MASPRTCNSDSKDGVCVATGSSLNELLQQKRIRIALGVVCVWLALVGVDQLLDGANEVDWLRGGGNLLVWGGS
jgi:hypothetical protein